MRRTLAVTGGATAGLTGLAGLLAGFISAMTGAMLAIDGVEFDADDEPDPTRESHPGLRVA